VNNTDNTIDSRDVISRIEELRDELEEATLNEEKSMYFLPDGTDVDSEHEELTMLQALAEEGEDYATDWRHGETLIRKTYFTEYAEEFANDIGAMENTNTWPLNHIDWEAAAEDLAQDYTEIDFDGVSYLIR